ncbi:MAG: hypothetical protein BAJATHORv1_40341 [Candidatus Thorarchaeota archaeon]|nr:MAG: hypothetical protein BAJATHORv1_40341 [Candidatus Thorarchaeota archaeon]
MKEIKTKESDDWQPYELYIEVEKRLSRYQMKRRQKESSITEFIEFAKLSSIAYILKKDLDFTCVQKSRIIVPKVDTETVLKTIEILSCCKMAGTPVHSIMLLTDDLNNEIELLTDYLFSISHILGTPRIARFYLPWS